GRRPSARARFLRRAAAFPETCGSRRAGRRHPVDVSLTCPATSRIWPKSERGTGLSARSAATKWLMCNGFGAVPMKLEGSCQCGEVTFTVETSHPVPYQRCYCSVCRKIQGGGGYAINLSGRSASLEVRGQERITTYHAKMREAGRRTTRSKAE